VNPRTTALLLLAAALLGGFVWWYEVRGGEQRKIAADAAKRLFPGLEGGSIEWIELRTHDEPTPIDVRAERREGGWRITQPLDAEGDPVSLDGMATALAEVTSEGTIESPQPAEVYGLGEKARVVRFHAKGQDHVLRLGKQAPLGPNSYASADEDAAVLTVPTYRASSFDRKLADLRERRILRFDRGAIDGIDVTWPGGLVSLAKKGDVWALSAPLQGPADDATVDKLLSDVGFLRAEDFVDEPRSDAELGLDAPELRIELHGGAPAGGGAAPRLALEIGKPVPSKPKQRAVRVAGGPTFLVAVDRLADYPRRVVAYRFKQAMTFSPTDARRIELTFQEPGGGAPTVAELVRGDAGWTLSSGEGLVSGKPTRLVAELSRLHAVDIVSDAGDDAARRQSGLAPAAVTIRVFGTKTAQDEPLLATLEIGKNDASGFTATAGPGSPIYRIDPALAEHVPTSLEAWRSRFVSKEKPVAEPAKPPDEAGGEGADEGASEDVFPPSAGGPGHPTP
jgi:hypothetical protein